MKKLRELAVRASYQAIISEFNAIFLKKNGIGRDGEGAETEGRDHPAEKKAKEKEEESNEEDYLLNQEERNKGTKRVEKETGLLLDWTIHRGKTAVCEPLHQVPQQSQCILC